MVDPLTGSERPVIGLTMSYVSIVGAGGVALLLPSRWNMIDTLRTLPDTVDDFTGFAIGLDLIACTVPCGIGFRPTFPTMRPRLRPRRPWATAFCGRPTSGTASRSIGPAKPDG